MLRCVIVDDEAASLRILESYIKRVPFLEVCGSYLDPLKALSFVNENNIDIVYLDINMPYLTGFGFIELLTKKPRIILTTAYSEYALDGYKYDVVDYLTKPIPFEDFLRASHKAQNRGNSNVNNLASSKDYIMVQADHKGKLVKVKFSDILYTESARNFVTIFTTLNEEITTYLTVQQLEEKLPKDLFIRIHKSYIIATDHLKFIDGGEIILDKSSAKIPLGPTYRDNFFELLESKMVNA